jgi:hypothetical protein
MSLESAFRAGAASVTPSLEPFDNGSRAHFWRDLRRIRAGHSSGICESLSRFLNPGPLVRPPLFCRLLISSQPPHCFHFHSIPLLLPWSLTRPDAFVF